MDGSDSSRAALAWAFAEAGLRGASLRAVHAWMLPAVGTGEAPWALIPPGSYIDVSADEIEKATHEALEREIAEVDGPAAVAVERFVDEGPAADVIVDASAGCRADRRRHARTRARSRRWCSARPRST